MNPLVLAMWFTGAATLAVGALMLSKKEVFGEFLQAFPRSQTAAVILFGGGLAWFLWKVLHLGEADFGAFKHYLFGFFLISGLGAYRYLPDFLAVRGLAILILLSASELLQTAYLQAPVGRLTMVAWLYLLIVVGLILGATPYRFRNLVSYLNRQTGAWKTTGLSFALVGGLILLSSLTCFSAG
ncbi:MAG: hypothetical protein ACFCU4_04360 [Puniceicoccaceae bacterium]